MESKVIAVASQNPVKIRAARAGFESMLPAHSYSAMGFDIPSGVSDQPMSCAETLRGATNRAKCLREKEPQADFCVGIEGGIEKIEGILFANAWVVVIDANHIVARGRSGSFALPARIKQLVESGVELGLANDEVFNQNNSKHAGGAIGSLTGDVITRQSLYEHAMALTLIWFRQSELFVN